MADTSLPESTALMPSRREIIALLKQRRGAVYVYEELRKKYGPPQGRWGSFCKSVMQQQASFKASIGKAVNGGTNGTPNVQSNAAENASPSNSGSKTGSVAEHSTPNVPMVIVREPDEVIGSYDQVPANAMAPDAMDMVNFQLYINHLRIQQLTQQLQALRQPPAPPPSSNFVEDTCRMMLQDMQCAFQMRIYLVILSACFRNYTQST